MEKKFTYQDSTVAIRLSKNQELFRKATEKYLREIERSKKCKGESKTES